MLPCHLAIEVSLGSRSVLGRFSSLLCSSRSLSFAFRLSPFAFWLSDFGFRVSLASHLVPALGGLLGKRLGAAPGAGVPIAGGDDVLAARLAPFFRSLAPPTSSLSVSRSGPPAVNPQASVSASYLSSALRMRMRRRMRFKMPWRTAAGRTAGRTWPTPQPRGLKRRRATCRSPRSRRAADDGGFGVVAHTQPIAEASRGSAMLCQAPERLKSKTPSESRGTYHYNTNHAIRF